MPATLYGEFIARLGGPEPEARRRVDAWRHAVDDEWGPEGARADQPIGDNRFAFWEGRWGEWQPATRTAASTAATDRWAERKRAELAQRARGDT